MFPIDTNISNNPIIFINEIGSQQSTADINNTYLILGSCYKMSLDEQQSANTLAVHIQCINLLFLIDVNTKYITLYITK
jgi:hypothetical protein